MRRIVFLVMLFGFAGITQARQKAVKLLLAGSGWNKIVIIDKYSGNVEWEYPLQPGWECNSAVATPEGHILFSYSRGAKMVSRDGRELWHMDAPQGCEMQTARVLSDSGRYLLAWNGHPSVIMEVDGTGRILSRTEYETGIRHPHSQFRQVDKTPDGHYLMPLFATSEVRVLTVRGDSVRSWSLEGTPFTTLWVSPKACWVACGDSHSLLKVDPRTGRVLERVSGNNLHGVRLFFVAGLCVSEQGGLYVCNWQGHSTRAETDGTPQLVELDHRGRVVWTLNDPRLGMISSVCIVP